jgi:dCMP deaminase
MKQSLIKYYMDVAERTAELSHATKLKVGSIAVKNGQIISEGCNGTFPGHPNICEIDNVTLAVTFHSEQNLIAKLCKSTISSEGCVVFVTHSPCINCSKILANAGVKTVYYKHPYKWSDGIEFLQLCGVQVIQVQSDVNSDTP